MTLFLCWGCVEVEGERLRHAEAYVAAHPDLPDNLRREILAGEVSKGMLREHVIASLGGLPCRPPIHRWVSDGEQHEFCDLKGENRHNGRILLFRGDHLIGWDEYKH